MAAEGPDVVANSAEFVAFALEQLAGRLRDWLSSIASGEDRSELILSQLRYAREDQHEIQEAVTTITEECRKGRTPASAASSRGVRVLNCFFLAA